MKRKVIFIGLIIILVFLVALFFVFRNSDGNQIGVLNRCGSNFPVFKNNFKYKVNDENYTESNAKILAQLEDEEFWNEKKEEIIEDNFKNEWSSIKGDIKILGYGLLCERWNENLNDCVYRVGFTNMVRKWNNNSFLSGISYEVYSNNSSSSSRKNFSYDVAAKEIAMNDIGNGGVFYKYSDGEQASSLIKKYLGEDFETKYGLDDNSIELVRLLTNNDNGTINYHVYIITDEGGNILYNVSSVMIDEETAKKIIANDAGVGVNNVDYLYLEAEKGIYSSKFSYSGITYNYEINAKDGTIIVGKNMVDIGEYKALEIAMLDAGIVWEDLWEDVDNGHMQSFLEPDIVKIGSGKSATYQIEIKVNNGIVYYYKILSVNGKILSKQISKDFEIDGKKGSGSGLVYIIKSISNVNEKYDMKLSDVNMDDIYKFKDKIILRVTFKNDKIISYILRDKYSRLYLKQKTAEELEELYNFESHYKMKDMGIFPGDTINLSELKENIIYKYTLPKGNYSYIELVNDLGEDAIVYKGRERTDIENPTIKYGATPYLKDGYKEDFIDRTSRINADDEILYVMYKKASTEDLLKVINKGEITYLSKYNAGDKITFKDRSYNENYLYNDTDNSLTVLITKYIWSEDEPIEVDIKPGKIINCSDNAGSITILN